MCKIGYVYRFPIFCLVLRQEGRTRLPKFKFSANFPIGLHVILQIQVKKNQNCLISYVKKYSWSNFKWVLFNTQKSTARCRQRSRKWVLPHWIRLYLPPLTSCGRKMRKIAQKCLFCLFFFQTSALFACVCQQMDNITTNYTIPHLLNVTVFALLKTRERKASNPGKQ